MQTLFRIKIINIILFALFALDCKSQVDIRGSVSYDGKAIEFARVSLYPLSKHVLSKKNGSLHFLY